MSKIFIAALSLLIIFSSGCSSRKESVAVSSPDGRIRVCIEAGDTLKYSVTYDGVTVVEPSAIYMSLEDGRMLGIGSGKFSLASGAGKEQTDAPLYRQKTVSAEWNYADLKYNDWNIEFRVFNEGLAWRFGTEFKRNTVVKDETAQFLFPGDPLAWVPYSRGNDPFANAFQSEYKHERVSEFGSKGTLSLIPLAVQFDNGLSLMVCESDQRSYPGMFLSGTKGGYTAEFAQLPDSTYYTKTRKQLKIATRQDVIAKTSGQRTYPWRIVAVTDDETDFPVNNLVYILAEPRKLDDISWIKPGQVAWEWWNDYGLRNVDFKPGVNTRTYEAYIDFASEYGLPYIIIDEGWSAKDDIMKIKKEVDLDHIVKYASEKNVGVIIWAVGNVLDEKLEEACEFYSGMGVKGFKIDFFDRDDQECMDLIYRIAEMTAKYRLIVDLHGVNKPSGLNRTYPNIVNFEGVFGLEEVKWSHPDMPLYDVTFPFLRQAQGPVDYTQGAFENTTKDGFRIDYRKPVSQGTRAHQVATYVVFDSPLVMLCDTPSNYKDDPLCTKFIASVPTVFDQTRILSGKIGEHIVTAREKDGQWYVGALNNWDERKINIRLDFLKSGKKYRVRQLSDKASSKPMEYSFSEYEADSSSEISLDMASGGGASLIIEEK